MRLVILFLLVALVAVIDARNNFKKSFNDVNSQDDTKFEVDPHHNNKIASIHTHRRSKLHEHRHKRNHHKIKHANYPKSNNIIGKDDFNNFMLSRSSKQCGYISCTGRKEGKINVHIVNHSHDDVGWLKTVDQYFFGNRNNIQRAGVQYIITSVINELKKDKSRKFIFVESAFFKMWWDHQDSETKDFVKQLVNEGRFEFISGGWSQNDEAAAHYLSIIDQMTLGHQFLLHNFGECAVPKIGWQIDPFGHSREQANLLAMMGFDGLFFGRLDYDDKNKRQDTKTMEMLWRGSDDLQKDSDLFTGVLPNGYGPPNSFCFDDTCSDEPIVDDKQSPDYNVEKRVQEYVNAIQDQAKHYRTNDLIHTMGSDFQYQNAVPWYLNLDRLMKYVNEKHPEINVFYSTPSCYLKSLNEANVTWNTKGASDFFPYSSDPHAFWSGYFTSRPAFKGFERWASGHLQSAKHLQVLAGLYGEEHDQLRDRLRAALGVSQHHDAITGTEKQHVYSDYVLNLARGVESANQLIAKSLDKIHNSTNYSPQLVERPVEFCKKLNVSECQLTEEENKFVVHLYNPVAHQVQYLVRLPVKHLRNEDDILLLNSRGQSVPFDVVDISERVKNLPERKSEAQKELVFLAQLNASSLSTYTIDLTNATKGEQKQSDSRSDSAEAGVLEGLGFKLHLDTSTGQTQKVVLDSGEEIKFEQKFAYYIGMSGDNSAWEKRASGAYVFRPNGTLQSFDKLNIAPVIQTTPSMTEVHTKTSDYVSSTIRVHKSLPYIEIDYVVGPIPVDDKLGKEVVSLFKTDLKTNSIFYTDSNGRQLMKRIRNQRPDYTYNSTVEPITSNYYPLNSKGEIRDEERQLRLAVLLDRSQGGTSMNDGELELMVHRRLLNDDAFGVGEALNEPGEKPGEKGDGLIIRGVHRVLINSLNKDKETDNTVSELAVRGALQPMIALRRLNQNVNTREIYVKTGEESILRGSLPKCVNMLTLETWGHLKIVRFEHLYGKIDQAQCSDQKIEIDISQIFNPKFTTSIHAETFLTGNQAKGPTRLDWKSDFDRQDKEAIERRKWEIENRERLPTYLTEQNGLKANDFVYSSKFKIKPTEIKTFLIQLNSAEELAHFEES